LRTNNDVGQFHDVENVDAGAGDGWTYALDGDGVLPSSTDGLAVNERPFTGSTEWTFDDAGNLTVIGDVLATQGEHRAGLRDLDARVRVSRNGEVVAQRRSAGAVAVDRAAAPGATYRVSVRTEGSPLRSGPRATMTLDGTNRADADGTPPSVDRLDVPALGLNGGVPAERIALNLTLSDAGEQASGVADVRVRYAPGDVTTPAWENGSPTDTWRTATVTESGGATNRTATLDLRTFTADRVSIAVRVTDGNGNVVVHHSYDSLAVGTGTGDTAPPRPGLSGRIRNTSGPASTNDSVVYYEDGRGSRLEAVVTNGTGQFEATPENGTVELTYLQTNYPATTPRDDDGTVDRSGRFWTKRFARDDTPDLYSLGRHDVDGPTDLGGPVALPEAGTLNVSVVNESGAPVADASVVVRHDAPGGSATARWRNDTDAEGLFRNYMTARPGIELHGDVTITVSPPEGEGYVDRSYSRRLRMDATDERIDVTLVESSTVTGRIETPSGRASGDDLVYLWNESTDEYVFDRTDADGGFEAKNVSPGEYALYVLPRADDGDGPTTAPRDGIVDLYTPGLVDATDDVDTGLTTLPTGHVLNVSVVDAWGEPVSDKRVVISHNNSGANLSVRYATDERGRLTGPDAGTLGVEVPRTVGVQAADGYRGRIGEGRTLTVTEDRHVSVVVPDTVDAPLTVRATPTDATAGEPIRVTLTRSRDGAPVAGTVTTNGTTYATGPDGAVTVTLNRSGTYEIRGQTDLETGRVVTDSVAVEVTADGGGVSRSGGAGGGGGGAGGGGGTPVPPAGIVDVRATDGGTLLTAEQVKGGRLIRTLLPRVASDDLSVEQLSFRLTEDDRRFTAEFTASDGLPSEAEAPAMDGALGYLRVETDGLSDERLGTARLRIAVSETALDEVGAAPADVELYRYHDGEWRAVETRHASGTTVVATTPGFSVFAVGVASAPSDTPTATSTATPTGSPADPTAGTGRTEETAGTAWTTPEPTETTGPGFGVVPGLLALAVVGLLALAARRHE
jgi:PGF-pre-PGF domain-containing protein